MDRVSSVFIRDNLLISGSDDHSIEVWNMKTQKQLFKKSHLDKVICVHLTEHFAISSSIDKTVRLWSLSNGQEIAKLEHENSCFNFDISPSGKVLAVGGNYFVTLWRLDTFTKIKQFDFTDYVFDVRFNEKGDRILAATWNGAVHLIGFE